MSDTRQTMFLVSHQDLTMSDTRHRHCSQYHIKTWQCLTTDTDTVPSITSRPDNVWHQTQTMFPVSHQDLIKANDWHQTQTLFPVSHQDLTMSHTRHRQCSQYHIKTWQCLTPDTDTVPNITSRPDKGQWLTPDTDTVPSVKSRSFVARNIEIKWVLWVN